MQGVKILIVDDDPRNVSALKALLHSGLAEVTAVQSGVEALAALELTPDIDIVLMDIMMPLMDGYDTIRRNEKHKMLTVIAVTGKVMAGERKRCLDAGATDYVPKPVDQNELFAALRPWLPRAEKPAALPAPELSLVLRGDDAPDRRLPAAIADDTLTGLKFLVVDDDYRNIFAMTAILERGRASVEVAESGAEAIAVLKRTPDIDIVLMDIMMPIMDGYDTIRAIRRISGFEVLTIVAVTGKAASGERERCLDSGADDYIPKPVDTHVLLTALAPWLPATQARVT